MNTELFTEKRAEEELNKGLSEAENLINDIDKMERFLQRLEKKLARVPLVGDKLSTIPVLASLIRFYVKKEYTDIPIGTILAVLSALLYFVSPLDVIPDSIPFIGYFDDAFVVGACWKWVQSDVEEFEIWRKENGKEI